MCGIAAVFNYQSREPVQQEALRSMNDCMVSRGPDGSGIWFSDDKRTGLAHRRLSIIDLSEMGAQPMHLEDEGISIVFNGEIYNYRQLRNRLKKEGIEFKSHTDTEVLLHLYNKMGKKMVHKLRGMFAFAIFDSNNNSIFLARDQYGIKPLYYADNGSAFAAASQVKALLQLGWIDKNPEPAGHVGFFLLGSVPEPYSLFKGIKSLPAGHYLSVEQGGEVDVTEYANITNVYSDSEKVEKEDSGKQFDDLLREALLESVKHHLIADVDVGLFLSAGLDSTTLTALASEFKSSVKSVTLGFEEFKGSRDDETVLANTVAERYNTDHHTKWVRKNDFALEHHKLFDAMDQPSIDGVNTYFVSKVTREAGLKVALSGIGGDEFFGGYGSFQQIPRLVNLVQKLPFAQQLGPVFRKISSPVIKPFASAKYPGLLEYGGSYEGAYLLRRGLFMPWELPDFLNYDLVQQGLKELSLLDSMRDTVGGLESPHARVSALESSWYMRNQLLRDADWAGMAHSLEIRVPLVDWDLLNQLAPYINNRGFNKRSMAQTPVKSLPDDILNREKTGFQIPVQKWIRGQNVDKDRGYRTWSKEVYKNYLNSCGVST